MKKTEFNISMYDWDITFLEEINKKDIPELRSILKKLEVVQEHIKEIVDEVKSEPVDAGFHVFYTGKRRSIVLLMGIASEKSRRNILAHEKRHLEDRIIEYCGLECRESFAYLSGEIAEYLY